ncbi:restriction endonuclease subunit S [Staphylococcus epidermidis]
MTEQVNTPELRFPEFSEEWREFNLKDISTKKSKKNKNKLYNETFTNSAEYGIVSQKDYFDKEISNVRNLSNYYIVDPDDFVYNPRISRLAPVGPINRNKLNRIGVMSPLYTVFSTKLPIKSFLEYYFKTTKWHKFMKLNGDSGARSDRFTIKQSLFVKMPIVLPSEQEQEKIGYFFSKLDQQIELEEKKLELLEQQKRGYMQKIFSQKLRFKYENGNEYPKWEKVKLQNIANIKKGEQIKKENIDNNGKYYHLNGGTTASSRTNLFNTNPFTISISEGGNSCGFIKMNKEYFFSGGHNYTLLDLSVSNFYLYAYLKYHEKKIMSLRVGSGLPNIQKKDISNYLIKIPSKEEQEKIGGFFSEIENFIEKQSYKVELLKERKKGLLQKMFI